MIILLLPILLFVVFMVLSLIHFNWSLGGKWGFEAALPKKENGELILNPSKRDSVIVGVGLALFGIFYLIQSGFIEIKIPDWLLTLGGWAIPTIFIARAIGDFKYIGFFKKIKQTDFGKLDAKFFSPLCLIIGLLGVLIQLLS